MEQFPLRGSEDGAMSMAPLGMHAEVVQWKLQHFCQGHAMKLPHPQALAMEMAS